MSLEGGGKLPNLSRCDGFSVVAGSAEDADVVLLRGPGGERVEVDARAQVVNAN